MAHNTEKTIVAVKKAKSLLEKIIKMLDEGKYCIDVIQQNLAVIGLIKSANLSLLEGHVNHCIKDACKQGKGKKLDEMMDELLTVVKTAQNK
jgi:CsoR family transcriptional regulator, copper-sensing transcriptional repressor